jgi:hypothetical protein
MPFARGDMRDHIVSHKTTTELRKGSTQYCNGGSKLILISCSGTGFGLPRHAMKPTLLSILMAQNRK